VNVDLVLVSLLRFICYFSEGKKKKNMVASFAASSGTKNQQPAAVLPYYEYISHTL